MAKTLSLNWDEDDRDAEGLRGKYDLVIASMTPAVRCPATFNWMLEAFRGVCYYSGWVSRRWDPSYYELHRMIFHDEFREGIPGFYLPFMSLYLQGYLPKVHLSQDVWKSDQTVDEMVDSICGFFHTYREIDEGIRGRIREYYTARAKDGRYQSETVATTGMMVWNMRDTGN